MQLLAPRLVPTTPIQSLSAALYALEIAVYPQAAVDRFKRALLWRRRARLMVTYGVTVLACLALVGLGVWALLVTPTTGLWLATAKGTLAILTVVLCTVTLMLCSSAAHDWRTTYWQRGAYTLDAPPDAQRKIRLLRAHLSDVTFEDERFQDDTFLFACHGTQRYCIHHWDLAIFVLPRSERQLL